MDSTDSKLNAKYLSLCQANANHEVVTTPLRKLYQTNPLIRDSGDEVLYFFAQNLLELFRREVVGRDLHDFGFPKADGGVFREIAAPRAGTQIGQICR